MKHLVIYVHGKGCSTAEAVHYNTLFPHSHVVGFDYQAQTPWEAAEEFPAFVARRRCGYDALTLVANSIGAYFSLSSLSEKLVDSALLISPVVDMERLILDMMGWAGVTEAELQERREIPTSFGETLSWEYLAYARRHPISWSVPTRIPYGEKDNLTSYATISAFAQRILNSYEFSSLQLLEPGTEMGDAILGNYYAGLTDLDLPQCLVYLCMMTMNSGEFAVLEAKDAATAAQAAAILQSRVDTMANGGAWYPEATRIWSECAAVVTNGNYVMMVVNEQYADIVKEFNALF